ncbi:hypothetical protein [Domibacillus robiginosus]|uniref:hypothetical protein n=1 Tax=Domibacillus robiginosus TaxID=1071054 RepID=UPI000AE1B519|nr:hypothetical protein [Domibacillus robiginosus]
MIGSLELFSFLVRINDGFSITAHQKKGMAPDKTDAPAAIGFITAYQSSFI